VRTSSSAPLQLRSTPTPPWVDPFHRHIRCQRYPNGMQYICQTLMGQDTRPPRRITVIAARKNASRQTITSSIWRRILAGIARIAAVVSPLIPCSYKSERTCRLRGDLFPKGRQRVISWRIQDPADFCRETAPTFGAEVYRNIWTPPALQAASLLLETGSDCSNIALSPGLKIRVSVVQFHPWRPFRKCPFRVLR
jgi:hypothetical protein